MLTIRFDSRTFIADYCSCAECVCAEQKSQSYASSIELARQALFFCTLIALSATYPPVKVCGPVCGQVDKLFMTDSITKMYQYLDKRVF